MLVKSRSAQVVAALIIWAVVAVAALLAWPPPFDRCDRPAAMRIHTGRVQTCNQNGFWR
jgi:hypothetical protein